MRRLLSAATAAVSLAVGAAACTDPAPVAGSGGGARPVHGTPSPAGSDRTETPVPPAAPEAGAGALQNHPGGTPVSLIARLDGSGHIPAKGGQDDGGGGQDGGGDRDGRAVARIQIRGDRITFSLTWNGLSTPTLARIHRGEAGANGDLVAGLFTKALPDGVHSAAGQTTVTDADLAELLRTDPGGHYVSLHTDEFPGGAVRAQLESYDREFNPLSVIQGGEPRAQADGGQKVPAAGVRAAADPDGHAVVFLRPGSGSLGYSLTWVNITPPLSVHLHKGALGRNGPIALPLLGTPMPPNIFAVAGTVPVPRAELIRQLTSRPEAFYASLRTEDFRDGAVRGQFFR
ncbi:hypothetical protein GCM10010387_26720 [Streptomyces inusitatus]|uniref:CHRD domain-containing protein n=1 Tax=Streptomyces inusitatus TaxID=68221 RepID=A0A918Q399_9ACTN|nr:CHRD domain-containing protein [Streptomyces inusitatus]GGZ31427.1 hypothetical protein GCM10010387_26720 [Streptomyces inusitatus]